jgi:hypothetical protein
LIILLPFQSDSCAHALSSGVRSWWVGLRQPGALLFAWAWFVRAQGAERKAPGARATAYRLYNETFEITSWAQLRRHRLARQDTPVRYNIITGPRVAAKNGAWPIDKRRLLSVRSAMSAPP